MSDSKAWDLGGGASGGAGGSGTRDVGGWVCIKHPSSESGYVTIHVDGALSVGSSGTIAAGSSPPDVDWAKAANDLIGKIAQEPVCSDGVPGCDMKHEYPANTHPLRFESPLGFEKFRQMGSLPHQAIAAALGSIVLSLGSVDVYESGWIASSETDEETAYQIAADAALDGDVSASGDLRLGRVVVTASGSWDHPAAGDLDARSRRIWSLVATAWSELPSWARRAR